MCIFIHAMRHVAHISLLLLVGFTLSLFWCSDADCASALGNEECACVACALLETGNGHQPDGVPRTGAACSCVCHIPSIPPHTSDVSAYPAVRQAAFFTSLNTIDTPTRTLFRPPIAS
jgi:hypothetical protein